MSLYPILISLVDFESNYTILPIIFTLKEDDWQKNIAFVNVFSLSVKYLIQVTFKFVSLG